MLWISFLQLFRMPAASTRRFDHAGYASLNEHSDNSTSLQPDAKEAS